MSESALMFDLTPTEEEIMTREVMRRFAAEEMAQKARAADEAGDLPEGFLDKTVELGLNFMPIPEALGGVGAGHHPMSNVLTIEDLAQGDMSMALGVLAPLAVINAVMEWGSDAQKEAVARTLLADQFVPAAVALMEPGISCDPANLATTARQLSDGTWLLSGQKSLVPFGSDAKLLLVLANAVNAGGESLGTRPFLMEPSSTGCVFEQEQYMGLKPLPLYGLSLSDVALPADAVLSESFDLQRFLSLSRIATAALAVGTCQSVLDYVKDYVNERVAFGEPISHRQSVAFMVADMATELEGLRLMVYRAASLAEQGLDCSRMAYLVHRQAIKVGMKTGTDGVQLLGGHGFIREYPVELWYRNLSALTVLEGFVVA
ncbi:MAG: alkylation response protein AidB-like acyl-CoA dehydrogenase [Bermanella sp.]|jgi:alkylation response protein AidB-like acyl-CoA dehydrogenase